MPNSLDVVLLVFSQRFLAVTHCLAHDRGIRINVLTGAGGNKAARLSRHIRTFNELPASNEDEILIEAIIRQSKKLGARVLLPIDEKAISLVIRNQDILSREIALPPLPREEEMTLVMDKWSTAKFLMDKGIPTPDTILCSPSSEMCQVVANFGFPFLVKPTIGAGGRGIKSISDWTSFREFQSSEAALSEDYVIQRFIEGHAVDCSVLCLDGTVLAYTIQQPLNPREGRFDYAKCLEFIENESVLQITTELVSLLNWSGVAHIDMQFHTASSQFFVLELNPRFWGTVRASHAVGVNFPLLACQLALGQNIARPSYRLEKFYDKWEALQYWRRKGNRENREVLPLRNTMWSYILNDPLPFAVNGMIQIGQRIKGRSPSPCDI